MKRKLCRCSTVLLFRFYPFAIFNSLYQVCWFIYIHRYIHIEELSPHSSNTFHRIRFWNDCNFVLIFNCEIIMIISVAVSLNARNLKNYSILPVFQFQNILTINKRKRWCRGFLIMWANQRKSLAAKMYLDYGIHRQFNMSELFILVKYDLPNCSLCHLYQFWVDHIIIHFFHFILIKNCNYAGCLP